MPIERELVDELDHCQTELREIINKNRWYSIILQVKAKNHDKIIRNQERLFSLGLGLVSKF